MCKTSYNSMSFKDCEIFFYLVCVFLFGNKKEKKLVVIYLFCKVSFLILFKVFLLNFPLPALSLVDIVSKQPIKEVYSRKKRGN